MNGLLHLDTVDFSHNAALRGSGGALDLSNPKGAESAVHLIAMQTTFVGNHALHAAHIYSESRASLTFTDASIIKSDGAVGVDFHVVKGGNVSFDSTSGLRCPKGHRVDSAIDKPVSMETPYTNDDLCPGNDSNNVGTEYPPYKTETLEVSCVACPKGQYSFEADEWIGRRTTEYLYHECPYGADCSRDNAESPDSDTQTNSAQAQGQGSSRSRRRGAVIGAQTDFWGQISSSDSTRVEMYQCPQGYCCADEPSCESFNVCQNHRSGLLCGTCADGFSPAIGTTACVGECGEPIDFLLAACALGAFLLYGLYLYRGAYPFATESQLCVYFFQMAGVVVAASSTTGRIKAKLSGLEYALNILSLKPPAAGETTMSFCLVETGTTIDIQLMSLLIPVVVARGIGFTQLRARNGDETPDEPSADNIFAPSLDEDLLSDHPYVEPSADKPATGDVVVGRRGRLREQRPLSVALIHLMMMAIDSIVTTTVSLIQCVVIDGEKRLYIQADVKCWDELSWLQYPLLILIVAIAAGFLAIPLWFDWFMPIVGRVAPPSGLRTILAEPFREGCGSWLFVMALERVALAMLSAQARTSTLRLLVMTATCLLAYHIQQQVRPFRMIRKNRDRGLHLLGLSLLAMLQFPLAITRPRRSRRRRKHKTSCIGSWTSVRSCHWPCSRCRSCC